MMRFRIQLAWTMLIGSLLGWPISALWLAKDEPQFVLALSWLAISITAYDVLSTTDVAKTQEEDLESEIDDDD